MRCLALVILAFVAALEPRAGEAQTSAGNEVATFAGGCFWCMEPPFDALEGVVSTISGYTGGDVKNPTYEQVSSGGTGHSEAIEVIYDPSAVTYEKLLEVFWHNIDPTDNGGQFCDRGSQYRSAIFYHDEQQRQAAESSRTALEASGTLPGDVVTEIRAAGQFYSAEDHHQNYYRENPLRYKFYRYTCGRDRRLAELWGADQVH